MLSRGDATNNVLGDQKSRHKNTLFEHGELLTDSAPELV